MDGQVVTATLSLSKAMIGARLMRPRTPSMSSRGTWMLLRERQGTLNNILTKMILFGLDNLYVSPEVKSLTSFATRESNSRNQRQTDRRPLWKTPE